MSLLVPVMWSNFWILLTFFPLTASSSSLVDQLLDQADEYFTHKDYENALKSYEMILLNYPHDLYALQGAATTSIELGKYDNGINYYITAGKISKMSLFYYNAGIIYRENLNNIPMAKVMYNTCIELDKKYKPCYIKLAEIYKQLGKFYEVQQYLLLAIQLDPTDGMTYQYLGDTYNNLKQFQLSIQTYKKSLQLIKKIEQKIQIFLSIGDVYSNLKKPIEAMNYYQQGYQMTIELKSYGFSLQILLLELNLRIGLLFSQLSVGIWRDYEVLVHEILQFTVFLLQRNQPSILSPYRALFLPISPQLLAMISSSWVKEYSREIRSLATSTVETTVEPEYYSTLESTNLSSSNTSTSVSSSKIIRLGYISRRFEDYPGTQMMLRLFQCHHRTRSEVFSYAMGPDDHSLYRMLINQYSNKFYDLSLKSLEESTSLIGKDSLDILVDYDGIHDFNSLRILMKLSQSTIHPITVTWLGFAGTTGMNSKSGISYILVDKIIAPPDVMFTSHQPGFTEKLVYLPGTYQPQDEYQGRNISFSSISPPEFSTTWTSNRIHSRENILSSYYSRWKDLTIREREKILYSFWFVCFNRLEKVSPDIFEDWMIILSRNLNSSLILLAESIEAQSYLQATLHFYGIDDTRIIFLQRLPHPTYLLTLSICDLFLDTIYYDAHTTASDGLYGSLPILTRPVNQMSSRISSSLNSILDLDILITSSRREYVDIALQLSSNNYLLHQLRSQIYHQLGKKIFNSVDFSNKLERIYQAMKSLSPRIGHIYSTVI